VIEFEKLKNYKRKKFFVTTPIFYINSVPSVGSAYPTVLADVLARFHRLFGHDVFFLTGLDENSVKTLQAAKEIGKKTRDEIKKYADDMALKWIKVWKLLNISNDDFIRTTEDRHKKNVERFFMRVFKNGDIYKGKYRGLYCEGCEAFLKESDLENGKCPLHKKEPKWIVEDNYFFRLSKYQDKILDYIEKNPDFIKPETRRNEIISFIKQGLEDISISRPDIGWGIKLPIDETQIFWVWFDALINYLVNEKYWPADVHIIGKDIIRFHCIIWPGMLMSAGYELPKKVFAHGFFTVDGQKMSKSLGNVIDPVYISKKYSADALRYFLVREIPTGEDGDFSEELLKKRKNDELIANYGNLFYRITSFIEKNFDTVPEPGDFGEEEKNLIKKAEKTIQDIEKLVLEVKLREALLKIMDLSAETNKYFQEKRPWELIKYKKEEVATVLYVAINILRILSVLLYPYIPKTADRALSNIGVDIKKEKWEDLNKFKIEPGKKVKAEILFKKS